MSSSTVINGFHVVIDDDGDCTISKDGSSCTLDFLNSDGYLCGRHFGLDKNVPKETIKEINEFAQMMGYTGD